METKNLTKRQVIKLAEYFNGYYEQRPIIDAIKANNFSEALVWTRKLKPGTKHEQDKLDELEKAIKNYSICGEPDTSICEQATETYEQKTETVNEQETETEIADEPKNVEEPADEIADEPKNVEEQGIGTVAEPEDEIADEPKNVEEQGICTAPEPDVEIADEPEDDITDEQETDTSKYGTKDPVEQVVEASKPKRRRKSAE